MKILIIGNSRTVFAKELQSELIKNGKDVSLLDFEWLYIYDKKGNLEEKYKKRFDRFRKIPKLHMFFRMKLIASIVKNYDVINIHIARWYYLLILKAFAKKKVVVSFYGSDLYRTSNLSKKLLHPVLKIANIITFTNEKTKDDFLQNNLELKDKVKVCRFGLKTLDFIDKNRNKTKAQIKKDLGYSDSKVIITCGYNSTKAQQHDKIIENIIKLPVHILENIQFIFPLTYGDTLQKEKIKTILKDTKLDYIILEEFLYNDKNANIKLASDIMINILKTDSFSGSMQEFLYAKNIVITGSWLPYKLFDKKGIVYEKINSEEDLKDKIYTVLSHLDEYKKGLDKNIDIIRELSSWDRNINRWIEVLSCK